MISEKSASSKSAQHTISLFLENHKATTLSIHQAEVPLPPLIRACRIDTISTSWKGEDSNYFLPWPPTCSSPVDFFVSMPIRYTPIMTIYNSAKDNFQYNWDTGTTWGLLKAYQKLFPIGAFRIFALINEVLQKKWITIYSSVCPLLLPLLPLAGKNTRTTKIYLPPVGDVEGWSLWILYSRLWTEIPMKIVYKPKTKNNYHYI